MKTFRLVVPVLAAFMVAGLGSYFVYRYAAKRTVVVQPAAKHDKGIVSVAVATSDLPWGTKLTSSQISLTPFLEGSLPPGYTSDAGSLVDRILITPVRKNEPITDSRLAPENVTSGGVSAVVKTGKRAVAVKGDKVIGLSGFINPGNRVDVLVTLTDPRDSNETTKLVLENIVVLATGTQIQTNIKGEPAPVDVYTLEVAPEEAEKLALAAAQGKLQFALRHILDMGKVLTRGATIADALASLRQAEPAPKVKPEEKNNAPPKAEKKVAPSNKTVVIEVIKGDKVSREEFQI